MRAARHAPAAAERVIKRYENRKLYDAAGAGGTSPWRTLARLVAAGEDVRVVDQTTGDDLTALILAQVVLDGVKERTARIPGQVLARLIRYGWTATRGARAEWAAPAGGRPRAGRGGEDRGRPAGPRPPHPRRGRWPCGRRSRARVQRMVADAQHGLESRVRGLLDGASRRAA